MFLLLLAKLFGAVLLCRRQTRNHITSRRSMRLPPGGSKKLQNGVAQQRHDVALAAFVPARFKSDVAAPAVIQAQQFLELR